MVRPTLLPQMVPEANPDSKTQRGATLEANLDRKTQRGATLILTTDGARS